MPEPIKAVPRSVLMDLCQTLGYDPNQVRRIVLDADRVTVEGIALRDGRPYLAGPNQVAEFMDVRPIDSKAGANRADAPGERSFEEIAAIKRQEDV